MLMDLAMESFVRSRLHKETNLSNGALSHYYVEQSERSLAASRLPPSLSHQYQHDYHNLIQSAYSYNYQLQTTPTPSLSMLTEAVLVQPTLNFHNVHMPHNDGMSLAANLRLNGAGIDSYAMHANNYLAGYSAATSTGASTDTVRPNPSMPLTMALGSAVYPPLSSYSYPTRLIDEYSTAEGGTYASYGYSTSTGVTDWGFGAADNSISLNARDQEQETLTRARLPSNHDPRSNVSNDNQSEPASNIADGIAASSARCQDEQKKPNTLEVPSDSTFLDPVHIFIRARCIEVFAATKEDMTAPGRGAHPSKVGRVGLRCYYCRDVPKDRVARQAVCFPSKRETIFESVRNFQRTHMKACLCIPPPVQDECKRVAEMGSMKKRPNKYLRAYYAEAASELGIIDTRDGLMFGAPPNNTGIPLSKLQALIDAADNPSMAISYWTSHASASENEQAIGLKKFEHVASESTRRVILSSRKEPSLLVYPEDFPAVPDFEFVLFHQFTPFVLPSITLRQEKMNTKGCDKRSFGLCCKHCVRAGEGKNNFPVELNSLADTKFKLTQRMLSHLMKCHHVSQELKDTFDELTLLASEHCVKAKRGSVKRFFEKIWVRMRIYYGKESNFRQQEKIN